VVKPPGADAIISWLKYAARAMALLVRIVYLVKNVKVNSIHVFVPACVPSDTCEQLSSIVITLTSFHGSPRISSDFQFQVALRFNSVEVLCSSCFVSFFVGNVPRYQPVSSVFGVFRGGSIRDVYQPSRAQLVLVGELLNDPAFLQVNEALSLSFSFLSATGCSHPSLAVLKLPIRNHSLADLSLRKFCIPQFSQQNSMWFLCSILFRPRRISQRWPGRDRKLHELYSQGRYTR
jgi:hypothetical protein